MTGFVLALLAGTVAASAVLTVDRVATLLRAVGRLVAPVYNVLVQVAAYLAMGVAMLLEPLFNLLKWLASQQEPTEQGGGEDVAPGPPDLPPDAGAQLDLEPVLKAGLILVAVALAALLLWRMSAVRRRTSEVDEERTSLGFWASLWQDLRGLLQAGRMQGRREMRRRGGTGSARQRPGALPAAAAVGFLAGAPPAAGRDPQRVSVGAGRRAASGCRRGRRRDRGLQPGALRQPAAGCGDGCRGRSALGGQLRTGLHCVIALTYNEWEGNMRLPILCANRISPAMRGPTRRGSSMLLQHLTTFCRGRGRKAVHPRREALNLTQPSVTKQVGALEDYLQVQLFTRQGKRVHLTPVGELVYDYARQVIHLVGGARRRYGSTARPAAAA